MYDYLRDLFNDEYVAAENRGLEKGRESIIEKMLRKGKTPEEIADLTARMPVRIHLVYSPDINSYLGRESMQYIMKDYRILP